jgi:hypothetical protein
VDPSDAPSGLQQVLPTVVATTVPLVRFRSLRRVCRTGTTRVVNAP